MEGKYNDFDDYADPVIDTKANPASKQESVIRSMKSSHQRLTVLRCKVVLVGDPSVGKTAITQMFHSDGQNFPKNYLMTLGLDFSVKEVHVANSDYLVEMYMYDSAGQSVYNQRELGTQHWSNASVALIVYDVGSRSSFLACKKWLAAVRSANKGKGCPGILVANKTDYREAGRIEVSSQEGNEFAKENNLTFFETSALRNRGITELFKFIADAYCAKYREAIENARNA